MIRFDLGTLIFRRKAVEFMQNPSALVPVSSSSSISTLIFSLALLGEVAFIAFSREIFYSYVLK